MNHFRIIVIDDNVDAANSLAKLLAKIGNTTEAIYSGVVAIRTIPSWKPDVVLLDIGLPEMDGYEVAREIRKLPLEKQPLLVAVSGYGQEEDRIKSKEAGFDFHLIKPVGLKELNEVLDTINKTA